MKYISLILFTLFSSSVLAQPVKLEDCKITWTPSESFQESDQTLVEVGTTIKKYNSSVVQIPCSDILKESDDVAINFYVEDSNGNVSKGLKGLRVQVLDSTPPDDHKKACIDSVDGDGNPVNICIELTQTSSLTFEWKYPTKNTDGSDLEDLAGFNFYYGKFPGNYVGKEDVGLTNTYTVKEELNQMKYFAVTAYNTENYESTFSNEVRVKSPLPKNISFFVAYDSRANPYPEWIVDDYIQTDHVIITTDVSFRVFGSEDIEGRVSIPGNLYGKPKRAGSNYFVLFDGEIENISPEGLTVDALANGTKIYSDRNFVVSLVPEELHGLNILQTRNNDKGNIDPSFVNFNFVN